MTTPPQQENTNEWATRLQALFEEVNNIMEATAPTATPDTSAQPDPEHLTSDVNEQLNTSPLTASAATPPVVGEDDVARVVGGGDAVWLSEVDIDPLLDDDLSVVGDSFEEELEGVRGGDGSDEGSDESGDEGSDEGSDEGVGRTRFVSRDPLDGLLDESLLRWELVGVLKDEGGENERFAGMFDYMRNAPRLVVSDRGGSVLSEVILTRDVTRRLSDGLGMVNRVWGGGDAVEKEFSWGGFFAGRVAWFRRHWIKGSVLLGFGSVTVVLVLAGLAKMMFA